MGDPLSSLGSPYPSICEYLDLYVPPTDGLPPQGGRLDGGGVLTHHAYPTPGVREVFI